MRGGAFSVSHYKLTIFSDESGEYFSFMVYKFLQVLRNPQSSPNLFLFRFTFSCSLNAQSNAEKFNNRASDGTTQWGPWVPLISFDIWKFRCKPYRKRQVPTSVPHGPTERNCCLKKVCKYVPLQAPKLLCWVQTFVIEVKSLRLIFSNKPQ